jgi:hypothetical protein
VDLAIKQSVFRTNSREFVRIRKFS